MFYRCMQLCFQLCFTGVYWTRTSYVLLVIILISFKFSRIEEMEKAHRVSIKTEEEQINEVSFFSLQSRKSRNYYLIVNNQVYIRDLITGCHGFTSTSWFSTQTAKVCYLNICSLVNCEQCCRYQIGYQKKFLNDGTWSIRLFQLILLI